MGERRTERAAPVEDFGIIETALDHADSAGDALGEARHSVELPVYALHFPQRLERGLEIPLELVMRRNLVLRFNLV